MAGIRSWCCGLLAACCAAGASYPDEIAQWRRDREERLLADGGWLTVEGLFWLRPGDNPAGADPGLRIALPASAPPRLGVFTLTGGQVRFAAAPGVRVLSQGKPVDRLELRPDTSGEPTKLSAGPLEMFVIQRGDRLGVRLLNRDSERRRSFRGLRWFPVNPEARVVATFVPYPAGRTISVPNVLGTVEALPCPGYAEFAWQGATVRLEPIQEGPQLFFIFQDATSKTETYPAGRFLYADAPREGRVVLDFNKAYNPPCAFTPYATCPLPPRQNRLPVAIRAGELRYP